MKVYSQVWASLEWLEPAEARETAKRAFQAVVPPATGECVRIGGSAAEIFGAFARCRVEGWSCALINPEWSAAQASQSEHLLGRTAGATPEGAVLVPTGGTGGAVKFAIHTGETLQAAAEGLLQRTGSGATSLCVLPAFHIGGLMQAVRAVKGQGRVRVTEWKHLQLEPSLLAPAQWVSLVPTQLARLIETSEGTEALRAMSRIFVGGAGASARLLERAREMGLPLCPAYGSTETGAQVCLLEAEEFLSGVEGVGAPLAHARVRIVEGEILVESESLFLGYAGSPPRSVGFWRSGDAGLLDSHGRLRVLGRLDDLINTGGEKVAPAEVERAIALAGLARECLVVGIPDSEWGDKVVVLAVGAVGDSDSRKAALVSRLPRHAIPKAWFEVDRLPLTPIGKYDRAAARTLAQRLS